MLRESVGGRGGGSIATKAGGEDSFNIEGLVNRAEFWELDPYWEGLDYDDYIKCYFDTHLSASST